jgi:hypothetical protein
LDWQRAARPHLLPIRRCGVHLLPAPGLAVRQGIREILLNHCGLYENLRARQGGAAAGVGYTAATGVNSQPDH